MMANGSGKSEQVKTVRKISAVGAVLTLALGLLCVFAANQIGGGFIGGFFQGAAIALLLIAVFLVGSTIWYGRKQPAAAPQSGGEWLPSRDSAAASTAGDAGRNATRAENE